MTNERLVELNHHIKIYKTSDNEFVPYGKVITDIDANAFIEAAKGVEFPLEGSVYVP